MRECNYSVSKREPSRRSRVEMGKIMGALSNALSKVVGLLPACCRRSLGTMTALAATAAIGAALWPAAEVEAQSRAAPARNTAQAEEQPIPTRNLTAPAVSLPY